jgi:hypothetical protein
MKLPYNALITFIISMFLSVESNFFKFNHSIMIGMAERGVKPKFENKVAIVTGGCQGIGRGCVDVMGMLQTVNQFILIYQVFLI